ncbi:MAG TPA: alpha/beta hydrolase-fold protein [Sediminibacterium sp.]|nr:alpha/beta hydrolase-fold protein [Sediminibacterium sp.]
MVKPALPAATVRAEQYLIESEYLERSVTVDVYLPAEAVRVFDSMSLLLINDGQDLRAMNFADMLDRLIRSGEVEPLMCIGIHCGADRKMEYGTAFSADYLGRGARAGLYNKFVLDELLPFIRKQYNMSSFKDKSFAGFSLGALSALDLCWNHASEFRKIGLFSASLWWRKKGYDNGYDDERDRLMHLQVRKGNFSPWLQFFIQCGTAEETADRNNNGVIDTIDDALDLIVALKAKGYTDAHIHYHQLEGGRHDVSTWASVFPDFLKWGWGRSQ